ncbi:MAG: hypothetical protein KDD28_00370 [Phaeodactylibacter sp.]|nr:hypothetical protein [Phaeodactylibacter sp.]
MSFVKYRRQHLASLIPNPNSNRNISILEMDWKIYFIPNGLASHIKRLAEVYNAWPGVFGRQRISRHLIDKKGYE